MKWIKLLSPQEKKALETLIKEMKLFGWEKSPDTKERYIPHYIEFQKKDHRIIITYLEFVSFETSLTVNGYVLIAITRFLEVVKLGGIENE